VAAQSPFQKKKRKPEIDREELRVYLMWALVLGLLAAFWLWSGCSPPVSSIKPKPPASIKTTYTVPDPCRTLLNVASINVHVVVQKDCARVGLTTAVFIVKNTADGGRAAADDAGQILTKFFVVPPELAPITITRSPTGQPVFIFAVTSVSPKTLKRIKRDMHLRRRHLPK